MLDILRRIVQEVGTATHLDEALSIIVHRVKQAMTVDVCSVYVHDKDHGKLVLMATDGLRPGSVGKVQLSLSEGLVGLVAERRELVNLEDAPLHPRYRYFPETGEELYHAFLGVPVVHARQVLGVLVAQQRDCRLFDEDEVAFFVTIAAQLAASIRAVTTSGGISRLLSGLGRGSTYVEGVKGAPGVAIGTIALTYLPAHLVSVPDRQAEDPRAEEAAFRAAVDAVQEDLHAISKRMELTLPSEERALFDAYVMLLGSDSLVSDALRRIRAGNWAPGAWRDAITEHAKVFEQMEDPYLRARAEDIRDIGRRVLQRLQHQATAPREYPERCILLGEEVSVSQIAEVPISQLAGVVSMRGSAVSHTAILARALGIPAVMGLGELPMGRLEGCSMVVDGYQGRVFVRPSETVLAEFQRLVREEQALTAGLRELRDLPAETLDGVKLPLYVNTGLLSDIGPSLESGADGVGLYRTEFPFMVRESFPAEDEQCRIYGRVLESFAPRPVTMRTLDIGGDKNLPYFSIQEDNPFLGWRGIRVTLDHPEIFLAQLRAMLRANAGTGNLRVLLPMVSNVAEVDEALGLLERAYAELQEEGKPAVRPRVGVMVEVPSAVYQADAIAKRVDFLSIGTNDLTQYLLAVDRNNSRVAELYDSFHPAVIGAVREVVKKAHRRRRPVSVCGEMAGDPGGAVLLLGMGINSLSMAASSLPRIKWVVRSVTKESANELLKRAMELEEAWAVRRLVDEALEQAGLGTLVRPRG